jgi:hypothetical protein
MTASIAERIISARNEAMLEYFSRPAMLFVNQYTARKIMLTREIRAYICCGSTRDAPIREATHGERKCDDAGFLRVMYGIDCGISDGVCDNMLALYFETADGRNVVKDVYLTGCLDDRPVASEQYSGPEFI